MWKFLPWLDTFPIAPRSLKSSTFWAASRKVRAGPEELYGWKVQTKSNQKNVQNVGPDVCWKFHWLCVDRSKPQNRLVFNCNPWLRPVTNWDHSPCQVISLQIATSKSSTFISVAWAAQQNRFQILSDFKFKPLFSERFDNWIQICSLPRFVFSKWSSRSSKAISSTPRSELYLCKKLQITAKLGLRRACPLSLDRLRTEAAASAIVFSVQRRAARWRGMLRQHQAALRPTWPRSFSHYTCREKCTKENLNTGPTIHSSTADSRPDYFQPSYQSDDSWSFQGTSGIAGQRFWVDLTWNHFSRRPT